MGCFIFILTFLAQKQQKKNGVNFYISGFLKMCPRSVHFTLLKGRRWLPCPFSKTGKKCPDFKFPIYKNSYGRCSVKKVLLESSQNSQENTYARVSFCARVSFTGVFTVSFTASGLQLYQKRDSGTSVFLWNLQKFWKTLFLQNTFGRLLLYLKCKF